MQNRNRLITGKAVTPGADRWNKEKIRELLKMAIIVLELLLTDVLMVDKSIEGRYKPITKIVPHTVSLITLELICLVEKPNLVRFPLYILLLMIINKYKIIGYPNMLIII